MSKAIIDEIINTVIAYEEVEETDEILRFLEQFKCDITEENREDLDLTLKALIEEGLPMGQVLIQYTADDIAKLDETINKILDDIYLDIHDSLIISLQEKLSPNQRDYMFKKIKEKLNTSNYKENRLPHLFKILIKNENNNPEIINCLTLFLENDVVLSEKPREEFCEILEITKVIINPELLNQFISILIENCLSSNPENIMKIICKYKKNITINNIKKIGSYIEVLLPNNSIYRYVFELYEENASVMLENDDTSEQLEKFLVNYLSLSDDLEKTLSLIESAFEEIELLSSLVQKYLIIEFDNDNIQDKLKKILLNQTNDLNDNEYNDCINQVLNNEHYNQSSIEKIISLLEKNENFNAFTENYFDKSNNNFKRNCLSIFINKKDNDCLLNYLELALDDLSDENLIKEFLETLLQSKISYSRKHVSTLWEILNAAKNSTSSQSLKDEIDNAMSNLKLKAPKKKMIL